MIEMTGGMIDREDERYYFEKLDKDINKRPKHLLRAFVFYLIRLNLTVSGTPEALIIFTTF